MARERTGVGYALPAREPAAEGGRHDRPTRTPIRSARPAAGVRRRPRAGREGQELRRGAAPRGPVHRRLPAAFAGAQSRPACQVRRTPQVVRSTAHECGLRGGEFTLDPARNDFALQAWMAQAEGGDAEAVNNVGEIYEQGVRGEPDLVQAAVWYRKAADGGEPAGAAQSRPLLRVGQRRRPGRRRRRSSGTARRPGSPGRRTSISRRRWRRCGPRSPASPVRRRPPRPSSSATPAELVARAGSPRRGRTRPRAGEDQHCGDFSRRRWRSRHPDRLRPGGREDSGGPGRCVDETDADDPGSHRRAASAGGRIGPQAGRRPRGRAGPLSPPRFGARIVRRRGEGSRGPRPRGGDRQACAGDRVPPPRRARHPRSGAGAGSRRARARWRSSAR